MVRPYEAPAGEGVEPGSHGRKRVQAQESAIMCLEPMAIHGRLGSPHTWGTNGVAVSFTVAPWGLRNDSY